MGFRIFAAGNPQFNYIRDNNPDMDMFEAASIISALRAASAPNARGAAEAVWDYSTPSEAGSYRDAVAHIAKIEFMHMLKNAVDFLAINHSTSEAWIAVSSQHTRRLLPNQSAYARYSFFPGDSPGSEFIQRILPVLTQTEMNNYGAFRAMAIALSRYDQHLSGGPVMIQIQLSKTSLF